MAPSTVAVKPGTPAWLAARQAGLGASDAATALGLNPWKSPKRLWAEKRGLLPVETGEAAAWGRRLEPLIAQVYRERTGRRVRTPATMHRHPQHPWMLATLDRLVLGTDRILECKSAGFFPGQAFGPDGTDAVPEPYLIQVQHQLAVTGRQVADLAVLIGGNRYACYEIPADGAIQRMLIAQLGAWWETYVVGDREPPAGPADHGTLQALHPTDDGATIPPTAAILAAIDALRPCVRAIDQLTLHADALKARIKDGMGDASVLQVTDDERITWKAPRPSRKTDWEAVARGMAQRLLLQVGTAHQPAVERCFAAVVDASTTERPTPRRLVLPRSWREPA